MPQKVTTTDDTVQVFRERDLRSRPMARLGAGTQIQLGAVTAFEGREWIEVVINDLNVGYVLGPTAHGHTTLDAREASSAGAAMALEGIRMAEQLKEETLGESGQMRMERMRVHLRRAGVGWLVVAALQFILSPFLSATWGFVCLFLGVANLACPFRPLLTVNGLVMIVVGIANAAGALASGEHLGFIWLGMVQVISGVKGLTKFASGKVQSP